MPEPADNRAAIAAFVHGERTTGPRLGTYIGADGNALAFVGYLAATPRRDLAFIYLHGIESHAGWFDGPARMLQAKGFDLFALDRRGSGINRENRGLPSGHAANMDTLVADMDGLIEPLTDHYDSLVIIGLSWGGKLGTVYELKHPDRSDALVLVTPGLKARVDAPFSDKIGILLSSWFAPQTRFSTPIEPEMFTTTPEHLAFIIDDPLRLREATAQFFMTSRAMDNFIDSNIEQLDTSILLFLAGQDRIIDNAGVVSLLRNAAKSELMIVDYPEQTHSIQFDAPERMVADLMEWLDHSTLMKGKAAP